jgi:putative ABC transport system ATP-binding protein
MLLTVTNIHKSFQTSEGTIPVLRGVGLSLASGDMMALTGESGSGKSTFLYLVAGLDSFDEGDIVLEGTSIKGQTDSARAELRRHVVGLIFQQFNLIPSLNVRNNLRFHARLSGQEDALWIDTLAKRLGLSDYMTRYPEQLSVGQQQRVAIGRTLAAKPHLILADEPTGNLDEQTSDQVIDLMVDLVRETGAGLLMATHSSRLADRMDHHIHLNGGRIE